MEEREEIRHPSFGMVSASRVSGQADLFGVDFPQQHYMILTISGGYISRDLSNDWFSSTKEKIQIAMSEVQWAKFISSPNTAGTPCTIQREFNLDTGKYERVPPPPKHMGDTEKLNEEIRKRAEKALEGVGEAEQLLDEVLPGKRSMSKKELGEIQSRLRNAVVGLPNTLHFIVEQGQEAITAAETHAKAEVDAYVQHTMAELGRETFRQAIADGRTEGKFMMRIGGRRGAEAPQIEAPLVEGTDGSEG